MAEDGTEEFVKVTDPGPLKLKDITDDVELYIFTIPKGLIDPMQLINQEIEFGGKEPSRICIGGQELELVTDQVEGDDLTPWLPNSKGVFKRASMGVRARVRVRLCLDGGVVGVQSKKQHRHEVAAQRHLRPVQHHPPQLPPRDFFATYKKAGGAATVKQSHDQRSPIKATAASEERVDDDNPTVTIERASPHKTKAKSCSKIDLESLTPTIDLRAFKKKKNDPLAGSFKNVFEDICSTTLSEESMKQPSVSNTEGTSPTMSKKKKNKNKKKDKSMESEGIHLDEENSCIDNSETVSMHEENSSISNAVAKKSKKNRKKSGEPEVIHRDEENSFVPSSSTKKSKKKSKSGVVDNKESLSPSESTPGMSGLRSLYLTKTTKGMTKLHIDNIKEEIT